MFTLFNFFVCLLPILIFFFLNMKFQKTKRLFGRSFVFGGIHLPGVYHENGKNTQLVLLCYSRFNANLIKRNIISQIDNQN